MGRWKILTISIIALIVGILSLNAFVAYKISHPERRPVLLALCSWNELFGDHVQK